MKIVRRLATCVLLMLVTTSVVSAKVSEEDLTILKIGPAGLYYEEVTPIEGVSAQDLYARALAWMAKNYASSKAVIQLDDKENNRIIGNGVFELRGPLSVKHTITFESREGRYKLRIDGLSATSPDTHIGGQPFPGVNYRELSDAPGRIIKRVETEIGGLAQSLKDVLQQPVNDDW